MLAIILFFISVLSIGGYCVFYFKLGQAWRFIALAYGLGTAIISLELFLYFVILRLSFSSFIFWFLGLQTVIALWLMFKKITWGQIFILNWHKKYLLTLVIFVVISLFLLLSFFQAIAKPPLAYDGVSFWSMRAKILLVDKAVNFDKTSNNYLASLNFRNYPWHYSLLEYWLRLLGGTGGYLNLISWGYFVSLTILIVSVVRRWLGNWQGFLAGLFFVSMPLIFYHAYNNYADLTLTYYATVGFLLFVEYLINHDKNLLVWAAIFAGWTMFVKNDGIFCVLAFISTLLLAKVFKLIIIKWRSFYYILGAIVIPVIPWLAFKAIYGLGFANTQGGLGWHPEIFSPLVQTLFFSNNWNIWWPIFIVSFFVMIKRIIYNKVLLLAWFMFVIMSAIIIATYLFTEHYLWALDHTAISRTLMPLVPISMLLLFSSISSPNFKQHD